VIRTFRSLTLWVSVALLATGCAARPAGGDEASNVQSPKASTPKRVSAAILSNPVVLNRNSLSADAGEGLDTVFDALHSGLTIANDQGLLKPLLAETVPSLENGLWKVLPDGRMETTWKLRANAKWHDGTPFTSKDLAFTVQVHQDRGIPVATNQAVRLIDSVQTPDPTTVTLVWTQTFIEADAMFGAGRGGNAFPLPSHILADVLQDDKDNFLTQSFWGSGFVGTGPYKLRDWVGGSHLLLEANGDYALGRPRIDTIEVKLIPDANTLLANILSQTLDVNLGRALSLEQAVQLRDQWRDGSVGIAFTSWVALYPQFLSPTPADIANPQFRRALMHGINRQEMVDTFMQGVVQVADAFLSPRRPQYQQVQDRLVRYEYDPARASRMLVDLGYTRGVDGSLRDANQQKLAFQVRTPMNLDVQVKSMLSVSDYWQRLGIDVERLTTASADQVEREPRANYPGFEIVRQPNDLYVASVLRYHGNQSPLPENNYAGTNRTRYRSSEYDALLDKYAATIPQPERLQVLGQILNHMSDQLNIMGLFYDTETTAIGKRLHNVTPNAKELGTTAMWNVADWDVD
jgi:peptide/nickel transport system substrate-binding protein